MPLSAIQAHVVGFFLHMQQRETSHSRTLRRGQSLLGREEDTESEVVWRTWDPVARGWFIATSSQSGFRPFSCVNVVGYDAILICHPTLSLEIVTFQSNNMHDEKKWAFSVLSSHSWQASVSY